MQCPATVVYSDKYDNVDRLSLVSQGVEPSTFPAKKNRRGTSSKRKWRHEEILSGFDRQNLGILETAMKPEQIGRSLCVYLDSLKCNFL